MAKQRLEDWINVPVIIKTTQGSAEGMIKYGVRLPMRPGTTPLHECELDSREKVEGQKPGYWFVNDEKALKIKLFTHSVIGGTISGIGYDTCIIKYNITKK